MGDVVGLPKREQPDQVWVCNCGCTTHYHHATGQVECGACGAHFGSIDGSWRVHYPDTPDEPRDMTPDSFKVADLGSTDSYLRRMQKSDQSGLVAMVMLYADGSMNTHAGAAEVPPGDRRGWLTERMVEAAMRMSGGPK